MQPRRLAALASLPNPRKTPLGERLPVGERFERIGRGKLRRVGAVGTHLPDVAPSVRVCPPIAAEGYVLTVWREGGSCVRGRVPSEVGLTRAIGVHHEDLGVAVRVGAKRDLGAVGGPVRPVTSHRASCEPLWAVSPALRFGLHYIDVVAERVEIEPREGYPGGVGG